MKLLLVTAIIAAPAVGLSQDVHLKPPLPAMPTDARATMDKILAEYNGVAGTGFVGKDESIGTCETKRSDGGPWKPLGDGWKRTLCGYLSLHVKDSKLVRIGDTRARMRGPGAAAPGWAS